MTEKAKEKAKLNREWQQISAVSRQTSLSLESPMIGLSIAEKCHHT